GGLMRAHELHLGRLAGVEGFPPARRAKAPAIPGLQSLEADRRDRRREVVSGGLREGEESAVDLGADRVHAEILRPRLAAARAIETRKGVRAALRERLAQDVARLAAAPGIGTGSIGHQLLRVLSRLGRAVLGARRMPRLDRIPDVAREIGAVEPRDLLDA